METISLQDSNYFSKLMLNYINQDEQLNDFYSLFPNKENYLKQAQIKCEHYQHREVLVQQISAQLANLDLSKKQQKN